MTVHETRQLTAPDGRRIGIDRGMEPLIVAMWFTGYTTAGCCQDLGESIGDANPRKATYWKGWALLELPAGDARRLAGLAAEHDFPMHWAEQGAWEMSIPVVVVNRVPSLLNIVQIHFPASQLRDLAELVTISRKF